MRVPVEGNRKITDEVKSEIIQERKKGIAAHVIAEQFGVHVNTINRVIKEVGLIRLPRAVRAKKILELCRQGISHDAIAQRYGISREYVKTVLHRYNKTASDPISDTPPTVQELLERREKMAELARSGLTYQQIAGAMGLSKKYTYNQIRKYNQTSEHRVKVRRKSQEEISVEVRNAIIKERKNGTIMSEIAELFGISLGTVNYVLRKAGLVRSYSPKSDNLSVRDHEIAKLRRQGKTLNAIAGQYGLTEYKVYRILKRYNKISDDPVPVSYPISQETLNRRKKIIELAHYGLTRQETADALGITRQYVDKWISEYNKTAEHPVPIRKEELQPTKTSDVIKNEIIQERKKGKKLTEIVKQFGLSISTVCTVLKEAGLVFPQVPDPEQPKRDQEIAELRRQGKKIADIGKLYGFTFNQVSHALRRYNETADNPVPVISPPTAQQVAERMEKIIELARTGLTYQQIGEALGIRKGHVQDLVRTYNRNAEHPITA